KPALPHLKILRNSTRALYSAAPALPMCGDGEHVCDSAEIELMKCHVRSFAYLFAVSIVCVGALDYCAPAADDLPFTRAEDVIYGRKHGMALTMDVFTPKKDANGAAVVWVVSGGWISNHAVVEPKSPFAPINQLIDRGYTVFAVVHGS